MLALSAILFDTLCVLIERRRAPYADTVIVAENLEDHPKAFLRRASHSSVDSLPTHINTQLSPGSGGPRTKSTAGIVSPTDVHGNGLDSTRSRRSNRVVPTTDGQVSRSRRFVDGGVQAGGARPMQPGDSRRISPRRLQHRPIAEVDSENLASSVLSGDLLPKYQSDEVVEHDGIEPAAATYARPVKGAAVKHPMDASGFEKRVQRPMDTQQAAPRVAQQARSDLGFPATRTRSGGSDMHYKPLGRDGQDDRIRDVIRAAMTATDDVTAEYDTTGESDPIGGLYAFAAQERASIPGSHGSILSSFAASNRVHSTLMRDMMIATTPQPHPVDPSGPVPSASVHVPVGSHTITPQSLQHGEPGFSPVCPAFPDCASAVAAEHGVAARVVAEWHGRPVCTC